MTKEYTRFGDRILQREVDTTADWVDVPPDDIQEATISLEVASQMRTERKAAGPTRITKIIRSEQNVAIAEKLGITADQLADRLAKTDENEGTVTRVDEAEFDSMMKELGLDPQEARDRFAGRYQTV